MKTWATLVLALIAVSTALIGFGYFKVRSTLDPAINTVVFESSDGAWRDSTFFAKGRDFHAVVWDFEAYKLKQDRPAVTLVRVTPRNSDMGPAADICWKVPEGPSSGKARVFIEPLTPAEIAEITSRADRALASWTKR